MVDTPVSSQNAQPPSARRIAASLPVPDDDDEPPSSGHIRNGHSQVAKPTLNLDSPPEYPPVISRDALNGKVDVEYGFANDHDSRDEEGRIAGTTTTDDSTVGKHEEVLRVPRTPRTPRAPRPWYFRFRIPKNSRIRILFTPTHEIGPRPTYRESFKSALLYSWLNLLLLFIPISWGMHYANQSSTLVFAFSCLAIIPLAALLGLGTEQIALRTSQSVGGLLNATLGNVVEMIIGGIALSKVRQRDQLLFLF
jgi:Ca2+:H+ antiporter